MKGKPAWIEIELHLIEVKWLELNRIELPCITLRIQSPHVIWTTPGLVTYSLFSTLFPICLMTSKPDWTELKYIEIELHWIEELNLIELNWGALSWIEMDWSEWDNCSFKFESAINLSHLAPIHATSRHTVSPYFASLRFTSFHFA